MTRYVTQVNRGYSPLAETDGIIEDQSDRDRALLNRITEKLKLRLVCAYTGYNSPQQTPNSDNKETLDSVVNN